MKKISVRLKEYRLNHNLTQFDMAVALNVSVTTYNHLENGHSNVTKLTVSKIANLLGIDVCKVRKSL